MRSLRFLFANLDQFRTLFVLLLFAGVLDGCAGFLIPIALSQFLRGEVSLDGVKRILPVIGMCLIVSLCAQWSLRKWGESLALWITNRLRLKLFVRAEKLQPEVLVEYHSGFLLSLIGQVAGSIGGLSSILVWLMGHLTATMVLFFFFTARESLIMAAINAAILILFLMVSLKLSRRIVPLADRRNLTQAAVNERFVDFLANIVTVRKLGIITPVLARLEAQSATSDRANFDFQIFHARRWFILHALFFSSVFLTLTFLLFQIELGLASASIVILFVSGFSRVQNHAERISELIKSLIESDVYVEKLESVLNRQQERGAAAPELPFRQLDLEGLEHHYRDSRHRIEISRLELKAGERILITGQSGQGKSSLLSFLAGQLRPMQGRCLWNGTSYVELDASLGGQFALVSQETELFNLSLRENLCMTGAIDDREMIELLRALGLNEFLDSLPDGLATVVGEKGVRLSAGQKQRINIARGLLLKRPILLLDEPTSHLDHFTEELVVRYLSGLGPEVSMVIVSHRSGLRRICSREYQFSGGVLSAVDS